VRELAKRYQGRFETRAMGFQTQDITASDYAPLASFDVVNMWDVAYHIVDDAALDRALTNIARSLKGHGLFLFTDWLGAGHDFSIAPHVKARSESTYRRLLAQKGFTPVDVKPLYRTLDKPHLGVSLDHRLGWLYYIFDTCQTQLASDNLGVGVWRREY